MALQVFAGDFSHETLLNSASAESICKLSGFTTFEAREHLGSSVSIKGYARKMMWSVVKYAFRAVNLVEVGNAGSGIFTRNFAFRVIKP